MPPLRTMTLPNPYPPTPRLPVLLQVEPAPVTNTVPSEMSENFRRWRCHRLRPRPLRSSGCPFPPDRRKCAGDIEAAGAGNDQVPEESPTPSPRVRLLAAAAAAAISGVPPLSTCASVAGSGTPSDQLSGWNQSPDCACQIVCVNPAGARPSNRHPLKKIAAQTPPPPNPPFVACSSGGLPGRSIKKASWATRRTKNPLPFNFPTLH